MIHFLIFTLVPAGYTQNLFVAAIRAPRIAVATVALNLRRATPTLPRQSPNLRHLLLPLPSLRVAAYL